jgi:hypothetical protein
MTQDNLIEFKTPEPQESFSDALSDLVRQGARQIIAQAVEAELRTQSKCGGILTLAVSQRDFDGRLWLWPYRRC